MAVDALTQSLRPITPERARIPRRLCANARRMGGYRGVAMIVAMTDRVPLPFSARVPARRASSGNGRGLLKYRTFGYGHSFGVLSHYYGREAGLEFREDIETVLVPGMVVSIEPMIMIPEGLPGAGGYREHDILVVTPTGAEDITGFPYGPEHNIIRD